MESEASRGSKTSTPCCYTDVCSIFFFQAEDGIRDLTVTGVQTCALPIWKGIGQLAVVHLKLEPDVSHRDADPQGAGPADGELTPDVERMGDPVAVGEVGAVARAVDHELDQLVVDAERDRAGELGGIRREEPDVARRDA